VVACEFQVLLPGWLLRPGAGGRRQHQARRQHGPAFAHGFFPAIVFRLQKKGAANPTGSAACRPDREMVRGP